VWSLVLHLVVVLASLGAMWNSSREQAVVAAPQTFDISVVPLSALNTVLPKGEPETAEPKVAIQKKQTLAKPLTPPQPKDKQTISPAKDPSHIKSSASTNAAATTEVASTDAVRGSPTSASAAETARISYQDLVATRLAAAKRYPERAVRRNTAGSGVVKLLIESSGEVSQFEILKSTSSAILDEELKDMVERAAPFPPFPNDLQRNTLAIVVPVSFRLEM
jgi:protein TonB